jgi:hypothetical protein
MYMSVYLSQAKAAHEKQIKSMQAELQLALGRSQKDAAQV